MSTTNENRPAAETSTPAQDPVPNTPDYSRSRMNAVRHGLTAREFVFSAEDADRFAQHRAALELHYQPHGPVESDLVTRIAIAIWRLDRATAIEETLFADIVQSTADETKPLSAALAPARTWAKRSKELALLTLYESRIRRALTTDKVELAKLQDARRQPSAPAESVCSTVPPTPESPAATPKSVRSTPPEPSQPAASKPPQYVVVIENPRKPGHKDAA